MISTYQTFRTHDDCDFSGYNTKDCDDHKEEGSEGQFYEENCLACERMGSYVDDEKVMSFDVAQQESIDPDVDKATYKIDGMTVVTEFDDRFRHVEGSSVFVEKVDSDDDVCCEDDSKGDDS